MFSESDSYRKGEKMKVCITRDNIISSLGFTTDENIEAVKQGITGLQLYTDYLGIPEPFFASVVDREKLSGKLASVKAVHQKYTRFEQLALLSIAGALGEEWETLSDKRTLFVLSTTKGNVALLEEKEGRSWEADRLYLWKSARLIAAYFGNPNEPVVVSNACISGVLAQIVAKRWLETGEYDRVVVTGADVLSRFVVSGFQSFKALSPELCRPFDADRCGLNLGEGAATLVLERKEDADGKVWLEAGAVTNDANHISGPSRTGEGLFLALQSVMKGVEPAEIGFLNAHGTATRYNDEMEAIAFDRAGLQEVPVYSLKGYFGHTLGASGILETVVAARALCEQFLPVSKGYATCGVTRPLQVVTELRPTDKRQCIKTASGFGGCNAAIRLKW